ncbi:MAG: hypothetical protein IPM79_31790 [Polyangiaceae bacterium]|nr:hypothetical protein [Polyangiaceae bacterium]
MYPRKPPGGRSTDVHDYPAEKAAYALRDVDAILRKARDKGHHVGLYAERLLGGPLPWTRMRQAYALLGLCDKYTPGRVEAICQSALAFDLVSVPRIARKLKAAAKPVMPCAAMGKVVQLPLPRFARPTQHFGTTWDLQPEGGRLMATKTPVLNPELVSALKRLRLGRIAESLLSASSSLTSRTSRSTSCC